MHLKQKAFLLPKKLRKLPLKIVVLGGVAIFWLTIYSVIFLIDKPVSFSYAGPTCIGRITLLPSLHKTAGESGFNIIMDKTFRMSSVGLVSFRTCFVPTTAPLTGAIKVSEAPFGGWLAKKTFTLRVAPAPVANTKNLQKALPTAKPLVIGLSSPDSIFDYKLRIDKKIADCPLEETAVHCNVGSLKLAQGTKYTAELLRSFNGNAVDVVATQSLTTLQATKVVGSSVTEGQIIYDKPKTFTVDFDKSVVKAAMTLEKIENDKAIPVNATTTLEDKKTTIQFDEELVREATYRLTVSKLEASDGSTLDVPYVVNFSVSGGPKVTGINANKTGLSQSRTIIITFDQALSPDQDITKFVNITGFAAGVSRKDNQVIISYADAPRCTDFTINISKGLESQYKIASNTPWTFTGRTICHSTLTIGYSKKGRAIIAHVFGTGSRVVLYTGAIHGNELSAKRLMEAWVDELEANARNIPADKQIVVVPSINPDGVASGTRNNSANVDLNRNFNTSDWQKDIVTPGNKPLAGGGGETAMSEAETNVIANFTSQLRPRLTMSFHSQAGYVIANQGGDSGALAATYARITGYRNMTGVSGAFDYEITGTYDDWIREKLGLASVLVELSSNTNAEFSRNKAALWEMARS